MTRTRNHCRQLAIISGLMAAMCGCGYTFGPSTVQGVRTIHVPVVQSQTFRRNIDYLLTEAIQTEIKNRSGYQLADAGIADTVLQCKIVDARKNPLSETRFDDVRELQLLPPEGYVAFRYFEQPAVAEINVRKHEIHDVVATVVSRAAVEIVTDKQQQATVRSRFRVKTSNRQQLRVYLPVGAVLQPPLLNSSRTTLSAVNQAGEDGGNWEPYDVNISRDGDSDEEFLLTIQFTCPITRSDAYPYDGQGSSQILRLPAVGEEGGNTVVQETRLAVWGPDDIAFVGEPDNWSITGRQVWNVVNPQVCPTSSAEAGYLNDWIGSSSAATDFARQGNVTVYRALGRQTEIELTWWNRPYLVFVISGGLLLAGFILRKTSWENRLTLTIVGCLAFALWSMKDHSEALQFLSAASLSLIAVAGIWIVGLFLGNAAPPASGEETSPPPEPSTPPEPPASAPQTQAPTAPSEPTTANSAAPASSAESTGGAAAEPERSKMSAGAGGPELEPGTVSPSPGVTEWMQQIMGGKA